MSSGDTATQHLVDRKGRLWQERTVPIKPNASTGYGFSLSGEQPVFVESVVDDGPAKQAGIKAGDRIVKVDGQTVFDKKHSEVVTLLKGATSVSLTVISQVSSDRGRSNTKDHSDYSGPRKIQELTLQTLKTILLKQQRVFEQLTVDYSRAPSEKLEHELKDCEEIIKTLQGEVAIKSNASIETIAQNTEASVGSLLGPNKALNRRGRLARDDSIIAHKILATMSSTDEVEHQEVSELVPHPPVAAVHVQPPPPPSASPTKFSKSPRMFRRPSLSKLLVQAVTGNSESPSNSGSSSPTKFPRSNSALNDSDLSDEDLEFGTPMYGPFSSLQELNNYPAHMSVFLNYLIQNRDPRYLCFYLVARSYQNYYKGGELRQKAMEIFWTFCLPSSPLSISLNEQLQQKILDTVDREEGEIRLKSVFVESRDEVATRIALDLEEFRHKRTLGLGSIYGELKLTDHMTVPREIDVSYATLTKDLKELINDKSLSTEDSNRNHAIADSICTFLLDVSKGKNKNDSSITDRLQSFTRGDSNKRKLNKIKKQNKCGHSFQLFSQTNTIFCDHCGRVLWGIGYHGYQCAVCDAIVHRHGCVDDSSLEPCTGKKKKRSYSRKASGAPVQQIIVPDEKVYIPVSGGDEADTDHDDIEPHYYNNHIDNKDNRIRSKSDPKTTLMAVNLVREEEIVKEQLGKRKSNATVSRTQSLKERRSGASETHNHSSQDTSLNTTPSWNSVASSSGSMSDESLNTSSSMQAGFHSTFSIGSAIKGSTLDTVVESSGGRQSRESRSPSMFDEDVLQELQDAEVKEQATPWRQTAKPEVIKRLQSFEIQRQELLKELIYTERTHVMKLVIMKHMYKTPLVRQGVLSSQQVEQLFPSLEELVIMHSALCSDMRDRQAQYVDGVVRNLADILLQRFDGAAGDRLCHACANFAANQSLAEKLFKEWSAKNPKFRKFTQDAESNPYCNRQTLKDLFPIVWTRLCRYQLLLENICKVNKKNQDKLNDDDREEYEKMEAALKSVINILRYVNKQVKIAENNRKLTEYQSKIDTAHLDKTTHPIAEKYKDLNLTTENRKLLHEGMLLWKISHRKTVEVHALLLTDILLLLSRPEDGTDRLVLKRYHIETIGGVREEISPIIRLKEMILRHMAMDRGGRSFLVVNNSPLMRLAQMYELTAESVNEKKRWEEAIEKAMRGTSTDIISPEPTSPTLDDTITNHTSLTMDLHDQLTKIDYDIQKLLDDKQAVIRALQGDGDMTTSSDENLLSSSAIDFGVKDTVINIARTVNDITTQVAKIVTPQHTLATVQGNVVGLSGQLHSELSRLLSLLGEDSESLDNSLSVPEDRPSSPTRTSDHYTVNPTSSQYDDISDVTVSPPEEGLYLQLSESTPQTTPLPDDHIPRPRAETLISIDVHDIEVSGLSRQYNIDDDDDEIPPPIPDYPPPSSSGHSSEATPDAIDQTPPNSLDLHGSSMVSVDSLYDSDGIVAPPDGFSSRDQSPTKSLPFSSSNLTYRRDGEHTRLSPQPSSPSKEGFRRVRSNPSISNMVIRVVPNSEVLKAGDNHVPSPKTKEYVMSLKSVSVDTTDAS